MKKSTVIRFAAIALALVTLTAAFSACSKEEERQTGSNTTPVLSYGSGDNSAEIPIFFYEFMLSRVRAELARNGKKVTDPDFWYSKVEGTDKTYEQYYNEYTLESCKKYLAAEILFEKEGLTLPESTLAQIDEDIQFYIEFDGKDDEEKFNKILRPFGVDVEALRRCYIIEAKYNYLLNYLYGGGELIGDTVKEEYYQKNYVRFKQILFAKYKYEYECDFQGNIVYFDLETGMPVYDTENGKKKFDENGYYYRDSEGQEQYFDENGVVIYDTEKGRPAVKQDENQNDVKREYTDEENAQRLAKAEAIAKEIKVSDFKAFEKKLTEVFEEELLFENFKDGYYFSNSEKIEYVKYPYVNIIVEKLGEMEVGEVAVVETDEGYHLIMKYELDEGKYTDTEYEIFFESLTEEIINDLFKDKLSKILPKVSVSEENLKGARSITRVGTNYDY
jgi:hypothetical protein